MSIKQRRGFGLLVEYAEPGILGPFRIYAGLDVSDEPTSVWIGTEDGDSCVLTPDDAEAMALRILELVKLARE